MKNSLSYEIETSIKLWKISLELAKNLNLESPSNLSALKDFGDNKFLLGTTLIKKVIEDKKKLIEETKNKQLNYDSIVYKSISIINSKSITLYALVALVFGLLFFSIIILYKEYKN